MINHLAIYNRKRFKKDYIDLMLTGKKNVDIKLSTRRIAPYQSINKGDHIYIKESGGAVKGRIIVTKVETYQFHDSYELRNLLIDIRKPIGLDDKDHAIRIWRKKSHMKYATVFWFDNPIKLETPIKVIKRDRRIWVSDYHPPQKLTEAFKTRRI